jgi:hypothetical protein
MNAQPTAGSDAGIEMTNERLGENLRRAIKASHHWNSLSSAPPQART